MAKSKPGNTDPPALFISYAADDAVRLVVDFVAHEARKYFPLVYHDRNVKPGESFTDFMDNLDLTQVVVVCCTPKYKDKTTRREGGVNYEFERILHKLHSSLDARRKENVDQPETLTYQRFVVVPLLISGTPESSIPDELSKLTIRFVDLRSLRPFQDKRGVTILSDKTRKESEHTLAATFHPLTSLSISSSKAFNDLVDNRLTEFFAQRKAPGPSLEHRETLPAEIFVKTFAYERVKHQRVVFLVGRKGSGKSTVAQHIQFTQRHRYKTPIIIHADNFPLQAMFGFFRNDLKLLSDMELLTGHTQFMRFAWELFVILSMLLVIAEHPDEDLSTEQAEAMPPIRAFTAKLADFMVRPASADAAFPDSSSHSQSSLFVYAFKCAVDLLNEAIAKSGADTKFLSQVLNKVTERNLLIKVIGIEVLERLARVTNHCEKRILLTLDGFDSVFQEFRGKAFLSASELKDRVLFELSWLRGLLHLVLDIKEYRSHDPVYTLLDFCFTVPRDRFHEVLCLDRDSFRYEDKYSDLDWSGYELCIMLRKRIDMIGGNINTKTLIPNWSDLEPYEIMDEAMRRVFPDVPAEIEFTYNGKRLQRHLFLYVLRHTFWRPRDILIYYSRIIELARETSRRRDHVTSDMLRLLVSNTTSSIINGEFINEYQGFVRNLPEILQRFKSSQSVLSFEALGSKLASVPFRVLQDFNPFETMQERIEFLYQIGFLGIRLSETQQKRFNSRCRDVFYFSEGTALLSSDGDEHLREFEFVIHPIFTEFLFLSSSGGGDLSFDLSWSDVKALDRLRPLMSSNIVLRRSNNLLQALQDDASKRVDASE